MKGMRFVFALALVVAGLAPLSANESAIRVAPVRAEERVNNSPPVQTPVAQTQSRPSLSTWKFLDLGVRHIWSGYDHLLFLFGLLVVCRTLRSTVGIITCFTLAHSLTLALATFNLVNLPTRLVEVMIAASIAFVGIENLVRRGAEPKHRWAVTFVFGLIHGFGFASVLRQLGLGSSTQGIALPLFSFNLGVEVGQIALALVVMPVIWKLRKNDAFLRRGIPVLSAVVAGTGLFWLLERTLFA